MFNAAADPAFWGLNGAIILGLKSPLKLC